MVAHKKSLFLLKLYDDVSDYNTVAGLEIVNLVLNSQAISSTHIESGSYRELIDGGVKSLSINASGIFKNSEYEKVIRENAFLGKIQKYQLLLSNGDQIESSFKISSYSRQGSIENEDLYSLQLESSGEIIYSDAV